jgi:hypothetical protein
MTSRGLYLRPIEAKGRNAARWLVIAAAAKGVSTLMFAFITAMLFSAWADPWGGSFFFTKFLKFMPALAIAVVVPFWLSVLVIALWIHRAAANAHALSRGMDVSPGWAVGWYFVPVANLFMPFRAMDQIWRISHDPEAWRGKDAPTILRYWWAFWIAASFLGAVISLAQRAGAFIVSYGAGMVSAACAVVAALLLRRIVLRVTALQTLRLSSEVF